MLEYSDAEKQRVKDYYAERLETMLAEAGRCGVKDTSLIKHRAAMAQDWALSNRLTADAARFADKQYWVQVEELETTNNLGILTFAAEHLETEPHQQALAKNPNTPPELLEQIIKQGTVSTMAVMAANPNLTDAMLEGLLDTADRIHGSASSKPLNFWPHPTSDDHRAAAAMNLRKAVLSALERRKASTNAEG